MPFSNLKEVKMSGIKTELLSNICQACSMPGVHSPHYEAAMAQDGSFEGNTPSKP